MLSINEIATGIVAWPDPQFLSADAGCATPYSVHRGLHPMVCIEKNETHGVWIGLSSRGKTLGGRVKMAIPRGWKIGSQSWIEKPSFVGDLTTSFIIPHEVMVKATVKAEFESLQRHRLTPTGAGEILRMVQRAEGYHLGNSPLAKTSIASVGKVVMKSSSLPSLAKYQRLPPATYADVWERYGRGETVEEISRSLNAPSKRIQSYIDYRKRTSKLEEAQGEEVDLSRFSLKSLRAAMAQREKEETLEAAQQQIARLAAKLGVEVKTLELGCGVPTKPLRVARA